MNDLRDIAAALNRISEQLANIEKAIGWKGNGGGCSGCKRCYASETGGRG